MKKNIRHFSFWVWAPSRRIIISNSIHFPADIMTSFSFRSRDNSIVHVFLTFVVHSSVGGQLDFSHFAVIVNSATVNMDVHVILWFFAYSPRLGGTWTFHFLRSLYFVFHDDCSSSHCLLQQTNIPLSHILTNFCCNLFSSYWLGSKTIPPRVNRMRHSD